MIDKDVALLVLIARQLENTYEELSGMVLENKNRSPKWKVTKIDDQTTVVDKLMPLRQLYRTLDSLTKQPVPPSVDVDFGQG